MDAAKDSLISTASPDEQIQSQLAALWAELAPQGEIWDVFSAWVTSSVTEP